MRTIYAFGSFLLIFFTTACYQLAVNNGGESSLRGREAKLIEAQKEGANKVVTGEVPGAVIKFPPGSISIDTTVSIEEGAPVATEATSAELSLETSIQSTGTAVTIQSSSAADAVDPFTLSLPLPLALSALNLDNLVVIYRVSAENKTVTGLIPRSSLTINEDGVHLETRFFGSYQTAILKDFVGESLQVESHAKILSKAAIQKLPAIAVSAREPFVMHEGETITIKGVNFRASMMLAFNGKAVSGLQVSDASATFVAPKVEGFGVMQLTAEQDGVTQNVSLFYAGSNSDLPIITEAESEVCAGKQYYDAKGAVRTGSKVCSAQNNAIASCSSDGQTGCVTTASFPAANKANIQSWDLRAGRSIAGVNGSFLLPSNLANLTAFDRISGTAAVSGADLFDTLDDWANNQAMPSIVVPGLRALNGNWSRSYLLDNGSGGGVAGNNVCDGAEDCIYADAVSGLSWARMDNTTRSYDDAIGACDALSLNNQNDWRLPTQKELMQAYIDGIWSLKDPLHLMNGVNVGSASTFSFDQTQSWVMDISLGYTDKLPKASTSYALCVR